MKTKLIIDVMSIFMVGKSAAGDHSAHIVGLPRGGGVIFSRLSRSNSGHCSYGLSETVGDLLFQNARGSVCCRMVSP